jgi:hypothetical protein
MDYARLDGSAVNRATEQDVDMFMGNWHGTFPYIMHGQYVLPGHAHRPHGTRPASSDTKKRCLINAEAISYAMLEPGSSAHAIDGEMKGIQQGFVVNSGTGVITSGSQKLNWQRIWPSR